MLDSIGRLAMAHKGGGWNGETAGKRDEGEQKSADEMAGR